MAEILSAVAITIRPAVSKDADGIARTFLQPPSITPPLILSVMPPPHLRRYQRATNRSGTICPTRVVSVSLLLQS